ncbi:MAG: hypothetical protein EZS28_038134 [Streblomastix strix]|uniref:Uncharacterized protein n=1 Tax=Streblomastix strix TaxID=222440 RepID=A0A5J4U801_9EUKA|nr:MAG: hypothetical protein EZS28_038134 [Streblomastix strix]
MTEQIQNAMNHQLRQTMPPQLLQHPQAPDPQTDLRMRQTQVQTKNKQQSQQPTPNNGPDEPPQTNDLLIYLQKQCAGVLALDQACPLDSIRSYGILEREAEQMLQWKKVIVAGLKQKLDAETALSATGGLSAEEAVREHVRQMLGGANPLVFIQLLDSRRDSALAGLAMMRWRARTGQVTKEQYIAQLGEDAQQIELWLRIMGVEYARGKSGARTFRELQPKERKNAEAQALSSGQIEHMNKLKALDEAQYRAIIMRLRLWLAKIDAEQGALSS